jgi:hypothetical protein
VEQNQGLYIQNSVALIFLFADDGNVVFRAGNPHAALEHLKKSIPHLGLRLNRK